MKLNSFDLQPTLRKSHEDLLKWLVSNMTKAKMGERVGWSEGPDSGLWPSSNPEDYIKTYQFISDYISY